jgi:hypothetical protein
VISETCQWFQKRASDFRNVPVISENVPVISENVPVISAKQCYHCYVFEIHILHETNKTSWMISGWCNSWYKMLVQVPMIMLFGANQLHNWWEDIRYEIRVMPNCCTVVTHTKGKLFICALSVGIWCCSHSNLYYVSWFYVWCRLIILVYRLRLHFWHTHPTNSTTTDLD